MPRNVFTTLKIQRLTSGSGSILLERGFSNAEPFGIKGERSRTQDHSASCRSNKERALLLCGDGDKPGSRREKKIQVEQEHGMGTSIGHKEYVVDQDRLRV